MQYALSIAAPKSNVMDVALNESTVAYQTLAGKLALQGVAAIPVNAGV